MQRTLEKLAKILQRIREFLAFRARKICAISVLNANFCLAKCCIDSSESCADVRSFTPRALGKCNRVFRAPRAEIAKNSATNSSFDDANFARARRQTRKLSSQDAPPTQPRAVPTFHCFATTPAGFVVCCASQTQKICNEIANFCAENLHDLGGVGVAREFLALPNAALTQARMPRRLNREFGRRQEFCAAHARETRENFARGSLS